jgi:hypothetical protein
MSLAVSAEDISVEVTDAGRGFSFDAARRILTGEMLHDDGKPGSGLFFLRHLARLFDGHLMVDSNGEGLGARARFTCSRERFEDVSSRSIVGPDRDAGDVRAILTRQPETGAEDGDPKPLPRRN